MEVNCDDLSIPHKVVVPARFAVLERLLHLATTIDNIFEKHFISD